MKTNVLQVLPPSLFCCSLCATITGHLPNPEMGGGITTPEIFVIM